MKASLASFFYDIDSSIDSERKFPALIDMYWVLIQIMSSGSMWLTGLFITILGVIPFLTIQPFSNNFSFKDFINAVKGVNVYKISKRNNHGVVASNTYVNQAFEA